MNLPTFTEEKAFWNRGFPHVAGVDEVGRGCFAGPVVAGAVILPKDFNATDEINDSKLLTPRKRLKLSEIIKKHAIAYSIAEVSVEIINAIGVGKAAQQAFRLAVAQLAIIPDYILIDAFFIDGIDKSKQKPIIHGDRISTSIAAASIIAKVYRDQLMEKLHEQYAVYDFFANKGYGTKKHREAIGKYGFCELHRRSFDLEKFLT